MKKITFRQLARYCNRRKNPPAHPFFLCDILQNRTHFSDRTVRVREMPDDRCLKKNCPIWKKLEDV